MYSGLSNHKFTFSCCKAIAYLQSQPKHSFRLTYEGRHVNWLFFIMKAASLDLHLKKMLTIAGIVSSALRRTHLKSVEQFSPNTENMEAAERHS